MKVWYLAGKISDPNPLEQQKNIDRFHSKAQELEYEGMMIYNPVADEPEGKSWEYYLANDIAWIHQNKPHGIFLMKGWEESLGARLEHETALSLGMEVIFEE